MKGIAITDIFLEWMLASHVLQMLGVDQAYCTNVQLTQDMLLDEDTNNNSASATQDIGAGVVGIPHSH